MPGTTRWINPTVLGSARLRVRLSPQRVEELSARLGAPFSRIGADDLEDWESGLSDPSMVDLETLAQLYGCPVGYFVLDHLPEPTHPIAFRSAPGVGDQISYETRHSIDEFVDCMDWISGIVHDLNFSWPVDVPRAAPSQNIRSLSASERERLGFSRAVRSTWNGYSDAFGWWRKAIESHGVIVLELALNTNEVRGASTWIRTGVPGILVNKHDSDSSTGRLFSLLHEYGHLLFGEAGTACSLASGSDVESRANRFAVSMLASDDEIAQVLRERDTDHFRENWSDYLLDQLRKPLFVSRDVLALWLEHNHKAPGGFYARKRSVWQTRRRSVGWSSRGGPRKEEQLLRKLGYSALGLLVSPSVIDQIPTVELCNALDTNIEKLDDVVERCRSFLAVSGREQ